MKVYGFKKDEAGIMEVENTLKAEQEFVGGLIEVVALTEELDLVCNEEGKINGLKPNIAWLEDGKLVEIICGDCFICRSNSEGEFTDIMESDIPSIKRKLKTIIAFVGDSVLLKQE